MYALNMCQCKWQRGKDTEREPRRRNADHVDSSICFTRRAATLARPLAGRQGGCQRALLPCSWVLSAIPPLPSSLPLPWHFSLFSSFSLFLSLSLSHSFSLSPLFSTLVTAVQGSCSLATRSYCRTTTFLTNYQCSLYLFTSFTWRNNHATYSFSLIEWDWKTNWLTDWLAHDEVEEIQSVTFVLGDDELHIDVTGDLVTLYPADSHGDLLSLHISS